MRAWLRIRCPLSRSTVLAAVTSTTIKSSRVSTTWRVRPLTFLPAS